MSCPPTDSVKAGLKRRYTHAAHPMLVLVPNILWQQDGRHKVVLRHGLKRSRERRTYLYRPNPIGRHFSRRGIALGLPCEPVLKRAALQACCQQPALPVDRRARVGIDGRLLNTL